MALIECWECGGQVSEFAAACPRCGAPQGGKRPKRHRGRRRLIRLLILLGLAWMLFRYAQRQGWIDAEMTQRVRGALPPPVESALSDVVDGFAKCRNRSSEVVIARAIERG